MGFLGCLAWQLSPTERQPQDLWAPGTVVLWAAGFLCAVRPNQTQTNAVRTQRHGKPKCINLGIFFPSIFRGAVRTCPWWGQSLLAVLALLGSLGLPSAPGLLKCSRISQVLLGLPSALGPPKCSQVLPGLLLRRTRRQWDPRPHPPRMRIFPRERAALPLRARPLNLTAWCSTGDHNMLNPGTERILLSWEEGDNGMSQVSLLFS